MEPFGRRTILVTSFLVVVCSKVNGTNFRLIPWNPIFFTYGLIKIHRYSIRAARTWQSNTNTRSQRSLRGRSDGNSWNESGSAQRWAFRYCLQLGTLQKNTFGVIAKKETKRKQSKQYSVLLIAESCNWQTLTTVSETRNQNSLHTTLEGSSGRQSKHLKITLPLQSFQFLLVLFGNCWIIQHFPWFSKRNPISALYVLNPWSGNLFSISAFRISTSAAKAVFL